MDDHEFFHGDQDFAQEDEDPFEDDYYAFLNLRKEATDDEINNAYRRLSRIYHPDKHSDPEKKSKAEKLFNKTKTIYEVLRDPHKRAIYDNLGLKGLEVDGWELVERAKTPAQIREEYERLAWLEEERRLQQQTNPRGVIVMNVNATDMFPAYPVDLSDDYEEEGFFPTIEVSGMSFSQSIEAPMTSKNTACLSGQLQTNNGVGSGSMNCSLRRLTSAKGWTEFDVGFGNGLMFSAKGFRTISKRSYATLTGDVHFTSRGISPGLALNMAYQLNEQYQGVLTWKAGRQSGMTTTLLRNTSFTHTAASLHLGLPSIFGSLSCTWKLQEIDLKLKAGVKAGTFGYLLEGSAEKKISCYTNIGMTLMVGMPVGVSVRLRLVRSTQTYMCNVALCDDIMPAPVVYGVVVPLLGYAVLKSLIIDPYKREQEAMETRRRREAFAARLSEKKREAEAAVELMAETYHRNKISEETRNGLVLVRALYGKMDANSNDISTMEGDSIDVTIPLQCHVKEAKLIIYESTKSQLPGFYDPCLGEEKVVVIEYLFKGRMHRAVSRDKEPIRIPKHCHCIEPS